ncbi:hypothetical protein [Kribbella sp. NPDC050470]|uniref:hypothetical protein n=1 Tax=unclassified Kribbella TaxID=2644121 RepID=UPI00379DE5BA
MTAKDLKDLLQTVAGDSTRVELDEHRLVPQIRRRRRRRTVLAGAVGLGTAGALAVSAYAVLPGADRAEVANPGPTVVSTFAPRPFECGAAFPAPGTGASIRQVTQTTITESRSGWTGTVQLVQTNAVDRTMVIGKPPRHLAVIQENKVVGHAELTVAIGVVRIPPKQTHTSPAGIVIRGCGGARLPAGSYLLYEDLARSSKPAAGPASLVPLGRIELR